MGNQSSCKTCSNSIMFSEDDDEDMAASMGYKIISWSYTPTSFPGTELRPVQPIYNDSDRPLQYGNEKPKNHRKKTVVLVDKEYKKNRYPLSKKVRDLREEVILEENTNNNITKMEMNEKMESEKAVEIHKSCKTGFPTGRVYISMSHDPITRRLKVAIIKAKDLSCKRAEGKDKCGINCSDSYMTVSLVEGKRLMETHTTAIKSGYSEVLYYENFAFHLNELNLKNLSVVITAKHSNKHGFIKHYHDIGKVIVDGQLCFDGQTDRHLVDIISHPGHTLYKWHTLQG